MITYEWIYNRLNKLDKKGRALLHLYVYNGKKKYFNTKIKVRPNEWQSGKIIRHLDKVSYNEKINEYERYLESMSSQNKTIERITFDLECIRDGKRSETLFIDYIKKKLKSFAHFEKSTVAQHEILINYLESFSQIQTFEDITYSKMSDFKAFLSSQKDRRYKQENAPLLSQNYVRSMLIILNPYINEALKDSHISTNPLTLISKPKVQKKVIYLDLKEVEQISDLYMGKYNQAAQHTRDLFLFLCYTGLRVGDLEKLEPGFVKNGILRIDPQKTDKYKTAVILDLNYMFWGRALDLFKSFTLPIKIPSQGRRYLPRIAKAAGIDKKITWHTARHSCAMNLLDLGFALEDVQKVLGHRSIQTTEVYARMRNETLNNRIREKFK